MVQGDKGSWARDGLELTWFLFRAGAPEVVVAVLRHLDALAALARAADGLRRGPPLPPRAEQCAMT